MISGYVNILVSEISNRQYVEKWFTTSSGTVGKQGKENKSELPLIRLKGRYQVVDVLPIEFYKDFKTVRGNVFNFYSRYKVDVIYSRCILWLCFLQNLKV